MLVVPTNFNGWSNIWQVVVSFVYLSSDRFTGN